MDERIRLNTHGDPKLSDGKMSSVRATPEAGRRCPKCGKKIKSKMPMLLHYQLEHGEDD